MTFSSTTLSHHKCRTAVCQEINRLPLRRVGALMRVSRSPQFLAKAYFVSARGCSAIAFDTKICQLFHRSAFPWASMLRLATSISLGHRGVSWRQNREVFAGSPLSRLARRGRNQEPDEYPVNANIVLYILKPTGLQLRLHCILYQASLVVQKSTSLNFITSLPQAHHPAVRCRAKTSSAEYR